MARARDELMDTVTDAVTRSFRPAFADRRRARPRWPPCPALFVGRSPTAARGAAGRRRRTCVDGRRRRARRSSGSRPARRRARRRRARRRRVRRRGPVHGARPTRSPAAASTASVQRDRPVGAQRRGVRAGHDPRATRAVARPEQRLRRRRRGTTTRWRRRCASAPTGRSTTPTTATRSPGWVAAALGFVVDRAPDRLARRAHPDRRLTEPWWRSCVTASGDLCGDTEACVRRARPSGSERSSTAR